MVGGVVGGGGWGIRRRDLGPKDKEQQQGDNADTSGNVPDDEESGREKMANEMAAEPAQRSQPNGSQTEKS